MKFCCKEFKRTWELRRESGINIRIVKIDNIGNKVNYYYAMTIGYEETEIKVPKVFINYCPYCGKKLRRFYNNDNYINEQNHSFLKFIKNN